jgi:large subunit ribosomal protein L15
MTISLNKLGQKKKARKRVGRGNASGHGTFSTRGSKGQRARSGGSKGLKMKGFRRTLMSMPKFKGMLPRFPKAQVIPTELLDKHFSDGATVNPSALLEKKLIDSLDLPVKILVGKAISKKLTVEGCRVSKAAADMIVKAGGEVVVPKKKDEPKK